MPTPEFIDIKTSLGDMLISTDQIAYIQKAKVAGGKESDDTCIINLKTSVAGFSGLVVKYSYEQLRRLLEADYPKRL
jgi:hypothetical protein